MNDIPRVGLVVPNYNGSRYLQDCLESIVCQVPCPRCVVVDGASTDESVAIAKKYCRSVDVVTERDNGQADAIRKGFEYLDTELVGWLNSDDCLLPGAIMRVAQAASRFPNAVLFHGDVRRIGKSGNFIGMSRSVDLDYHRVRTGRGIVLQPGSFYRRSAVEAAGGVDPTWHLLMDVDLWVRLLRVGPAHRIKAPLAEFRVHSGAKSSQPPWRYYRETIRLAAHHERDRLARALVRRSLQIGLHAARWFAFSFRSRIFPE